ncbi:MAG: diaminopimelate epimerase [Rhodothermales bacterium]|nr:diaminopimelate epimerase [Rhodothermales bacterium]MBO6780433.1 diaminopimelate epimerase [Rhodothermales bacterium]
MPPRTLVVEFTKMSGAGNDFIVIDNRFYHFSEDELSNFAVRYCARRSGVGADGLLALQASEEQHFRMKYVNADGSVGSMCGNGARCLARYAFDAGIQHELLVFETDAGRYEAAVTGDVVRLFVPPHEEFRTVPHDEFGPGRFYIWTGCEHTVVFVDDVAAVDVANEGARLRRGHQPAGTNVNFVQVAGAALKVRTFEKGVEAETLACGTGATASAAVSRLTGRLSGTHIDVHMPGGILGIGFDASGGAKYLEGPAVTVYRGTLEIPV